MRICRRDGLREGVENGAIVVHSRSIDALNQMPALIVARACDGWVRRCS